ncbi:hypothetical protein ACU4HD_13770 [Cupriavidus basilensis]
MVRGRLTHIARPAGDRAETLPGWPCPQPGRARVQPVLYRRRCRRATAWSAGNWLGGGKAGASVEEGIAKTLGIRLGDTLRFDVAGQSVEAPVTSLRKLDWGSMRVNFFVILPPAAMQGMPQTYITAFHLPARQAALSSQLVAAFPEPNGGQHRPDPAPDPGRARPGHCGSGVPVRVHAGGRCRRALCGAVRRARRAQARCRAAQGARSASAAMVRQTQYARSFWWWVAWLGLLASLGAIAVGWGLSQFVFDFPFRFNGWIVPAGVLSGMLCAFAGGWLGLREVLRQPALATLREA